MLMKFTADGKYLWADVGGVVGEIEKEIEWDSSWDDKKHRLRLVNDEVIITPDLSYQRDRKMAYPPMQDYLDGIVKNDQAQIDKYIADCKAVKDKLPKPTE